MARVMKSFANWPWLIWAQQYAQQTALVDGDCPINWQSLVQRISALAASFQQQGVTQQSIVALRGKNSIALLLAYLAVLQCGGRVLPLNPQLPISLLADLLPHLNVTHGLCHQCEEEWPFALTRLRLANACANDFPAWRDDRMATLTLTSGSSGMPKAAVHSYYAHLASAAGIISLIPLHTGDSWLLSLPLFHVSGQAIIWRWLYSGVTLVVRPTLSLEHALIGCTHASLVPTQLWRLLQKHMPLTLRDVLLGGAPIPITLTKEAERQGVRCWCGYGLTETASTVCAKRADVSPGVGRLLPWREMRLAAGEVLLRGETLASGYWYDNALHSLLSDDGWFHSRDCGESCLGELRIAGRMDNLFLRGGESIQPEVIERILLQHPQITQAFIVPVVDAEFGHCPVAVIEGSVDFSSLPHWLADKIARFQMPIAWYPLPERLKNGGVKIPRQQVIDWAGEQS